MRQMKIIKLLILILVIFTNMNCIFAQVANELTPMVLGNNSKRGQWLNQYTNVFVSSPNTSTNLQNVHNDDDQAEFANSDKYYYFDEVSNTYIELDHFETNDPIMMQPGRGYVLQIGGNGTYSDVIVNNKPQSFAGGSANTGTITVPVVNGNFALLGNPYSGFLNLDAFLLDSNNKTKVKGPVYLWSHNTVANTLNDPSSLLIPFSANDYALYNVLGGVAAGRNINSSFENGTYSGIQTPNGTICFGTGFLIKAIGSGNATFTSDMNGGNNGSVVQSFRTTASTTPEASVKSVASPQAPPTKSRIWLNLEAGTPSSGSTTPLKQLLIGYVTCGTGEECATNGDSDRVYDAEPVSAVVSPSIEFYSLANITASKHLAIQGRTGFSKTDIFKLGMKTSAGTFTITSLGDGIFAVQQPYYLLDTKDAIPTRHTFPYTFSVAAIDAGVNESRFTVVFENLVSIQATNCGFRLSFIDQTVYSTVVPGATNYRFRVRNADGTLFGDFFSSNPNNIHTFNLNLPNILLDTSYFVSVATYTVNGVWQFGPACEMRTPLYPTTSSLYGCSATPTLITSYSTSIFSTIVSERGLNTTGYRFQVSTSSNFAPGTIVGTIQRPFNSFSLALLNNSTFNSPTYTPLPSTTYYIRIQIQFNGVWVVDTTGNPVYGNVCQVMTSANPTPRQTNNEVSVFEVIAYPNPFATAFKLDINTSFDDTIGIKVYDMIGRLIESQDVNTDQINSQEIGSKYPAGVYNIVISQGDVVKTLRVIKR